MPVVEPLDDTDLDSEGANQFHDRVNEQIMWDDSTESFFRERMEHMSRMFPFPSVPNNTLMHLAPYGMKTSQCWLKERYLLLRVIEKFLITKCEVSIFGGYVRDMMLHHHGAMAYYSHLTREEGAPSERKDLYNDPTFHPESYQDRNTYPRDIDCFVAAESSIDKISVKLGLAIPAKIVEVKPIHCYTNHPEFTCNFAVKRMVIEYIFNGSLQKTGQKITISIDFVYHLRGKEELPCTYLIDCACNMLYMNKHGVHSALANTFDPVQNAYISRRIMDLTVKRITFVPPMSHSFRCPSIQNETCNVRHTRRCTEFQAIDSYRRQRARYRVLYRLKYLHRIAKLARDGWKVVNLPIKFSLSLSEVNSETICSISHEELRERELMVCIGAGIADAWAQTSVMRWSTFVNYLFSSARAQDLFGLNAHWKILCPNSRNEVIVAENRPLGVVLEEALSAM